MTDHQKPHAPYSPSKLPYFALCPRWVSDPTPGPMAARGTAVHAMLAELVLGRQPLPAPHDLAPLVERGEGILIGWRSRYPEHTWMAEVPVDTLIPGVYGTADVVALSEWDDEALLIDWKTGTGERDQAGASLQLAAYALGVVRRWRHVERVTAVMAELEQQPSEVVLTKADIERAAGEIRTVVERARAAREGDEVPGERQCKYCARRASCPALQRLTAEVTQQAAALAAQVKDLPAEQVGALLDRYREPAALVAQFVATLEERAKALIAAGETVPGWAVHETAGTRRWRVSEDEAVQAVWRWGANHGSGTAPRPELTQICTPAEAERRLVEWVLRHTGGIRTKAEAQRQVRKLLEPLTAAEPRRTLAPEGGRQRRG